MIIETVCVDGVMHSFILNDGNIFKKADLTIHAAYSDGRAGSYVVTDIAQFRDIVEKARLDRADLLVRYDNLATLLAKRAHELKQALDNGSSPRALISIRVKNSTMRERRAMSLGFIAQSYQLYKDKKITWQGMDYFDPNDLLHTPAEVIELEKKGKQKEST